MSIVSATDFSERAGRAATVAALLAARRGLPLWLVHVASTQALHVAREPVREGLQLLLQREAAPLESLGAKVHVAVLEGNPADAVMEHATKEGATLLVVGATGRTGTFAGVGGQLDRFAQALTLPLLRVAEAAPFEAWARGEEPLRVLLAVDRSGATQAAHAWLTELRRYGPIQLTAGHVYYPLQEHRRLGLPPPSSSSEVSTELLAALNERVADLVAPRDGSASPAICLHKGFWPLGDELLALAAKERAALLVMGSHAHGLGELWSLTHHALRNAPMAVAVIPHAGARVAPTPPALRHLLVATDLSQAGDQAIPFAFALAAAGATVHVTTVAAPSLTPERRRELQGLLQQRLPAEAPARGVAARAEVLSGNDVPDTLARAAERLDADLVCLSAHGRGGLGEQLLGSVVHRTLKQCRRAVLVVQPLEP